MDYGKQQIIESLSGTNPAIYDFLPYLLQDLHFLGTNISAITNLLSKNINLNSVDYKILDLCCGKGAALISLVKKFNFCGVGIDLYPPFIKEAGKLASELSDYSKICFKEMDIVEAVKTLHNFDIVLCGYDTTVLGTETETIIKTAGCIKVGGYILYEAAYPSELNHEQIVLQSGFNIVDKCISDKSTVKKMNEYNTSMISKRALELAEKYPDKAYIFSEYVDNQVNESIELEEKYILVTYLIRK